MAFSRSRFSGRRSFSRRPSFGLRRRRLSNPQRTKGLEVGQFFFQDILQLDNLSDDDTVIYTNVASIALSLAQTTTSGPEQRVGQVLQSMGRAFQINGLVFDWGFELQNQDGTPTTNIGDFWSCFQVLTDRIEYGVPFDGSPAPASIGSYSPFDNYWPTAILSTTAPTVTERQPTMPTRIHFQKTEHWNAAAAQIINDGEGILYYPTGQSVNFRRPTFNRRLRVRVDDNHGLFFAWHARTGPAFAVADPAGRQLRRWARGQLYYRWLT